MASVDPPRHVLLGGLEHGFYDFPYGKNNPYIGNVIIPIDELIFVRGVGTPTSVEMQIGLIKQIQHAKHSGITYMLSLQRCQKQCKYVVSQRWWICKFSTTYTFSSQPSEKDRRGLCPVFLTTASNISGACVPGKWEGRVSWATRGAANRGKDMEDVDAVELGAPMAPEKVFHSSFRLNYILRYWNIEIFEGPFISSCIETQLIADVKHPNTPQKGTPVTNVKAQAVRYIYQYTMEFTGSWSESFT